MLMIFCLLLGIISKTQINTQLLKNSMWHPSNKQNNMFKKNQIPSGFKFSFLTLECIPDAWLIAREGKHDLFIMLIMK